MSNSSERYAEITSKVFNDAPFGVIVFEAVRDDDQELVDLRWILLNDHAQKVLGKTSKDLVHKKLSESFSGLFDANQFNYFKRVVDDNKTIKFENRLTHSFVNKWYEISAWKNSDGLIVSLREISRLKHTIKELDKKESEYFRLFHESIDPIFITNNEHDIIDMNPEMKALFGCTEEGHLTLKDLFCSEKDFIKFNTLLYKEDMAKDFETELAGRNNKPLICNLSLKKFYNVEGIETYLGFIRNITESKKTEQSLIMAEKLSLTGKIARTIAHEVRNPLTNLNLALDQLNEELPKGGEGDFYIDIIKRNIDRIQKLINDLLNSSKPREYRFESKDLRDLVTSTIDMIEDRFVLKEMKIELELPDDPVYVKFDGEQLKVAFLNLMVNASEAMEAKAGKLVVAVELSAEHCQVSFVDNGKGIEKEKLQNLFEPFFSHSKDSGTGLGLTAVQNILVGHKGTIEVESEVGKGTRFNVRLPLSSEA